MAEDASGDDRDDRDGRDWQSEGPRDATAEDWQTDRDDAPTPDDGADAPGRRDGDDDSGHIGAGGDRAERDRIPIDLSGPDDDREWGDEPADTDEEGYVPEPSSTPIEAGDPTLEHAIFVLLGAIAMILVIIRLLALPLG
ncbi:hypothetical protein ACFO5R_20200 [Halosolutus amylolyticus]|uniref:DUF7312 domain-containing protein n=1 Tax=Halosolutus amylolyticus TaxID=2932267 RepID=A0ABD5PVA2_9EURY|nr:hypothetical protein [Halosolutus amylolyticus]